MNKDLMFSSKDNTWSTPQDFYDKLNEEFNFKLDPCCDETTAKCETYFTEATNGLIQSWANYGTVFMNPPYGRGIKEWTEKALNESKNGTTVVGLLPSRTDTRWFHDHIYGKAEIRFVKGRLKFGGHKNSAPFPSMVVVWKPSINDLLKLINDSLPQTETIAHLRRDTELEESKPKVPNQLDGIIFRVLPIIELN